MNGRRQFIWASTGVLGALGLGVWGFGRMGLEGEIVAVLRRRLRYLKLDEEGLHAFARDQTTAILNKRLPTWNRMRYHFQTAMDPGYKRFDRSSDKRSRVQHIEDRFVSTYLLCSDFFWHGADESRTIRYVTYFDPIRSCGNPFARSVIDTRNA